MFEGNAQALDHILRLPTLLLEAPAAATCVHINAEFSDQASDHDPLVARLRLDDDARADDDAAETGTYDDGATT